MSSSSNTSLDQKAAPGRLSNSILRASQDGVAIRDTETGSVKQISASYSIDPVAEQKLVLKFDLRILPALTIMYLFNSLDKANIGNAKTDGLEQSLRLHGNQYNIVLSVFFIPYVLTAPVLGIVGKKYGPSRVLPAMMFVFGLMTLVTAAVHNFGGLMATRWFLGMSESAFFPLVIYYLTTFYRRGELARRLAIFYAAAAIGSAFGGLIAFGVFQIKHGALASWRYLFIVEGSATILIAGIALWCLPYSASTARFLTEDEKQLAYYRIQMDSSSVVDEKFNLKESLKIFKHPTSWVILAIEICVGIPLQSIQLFLPPIIKALGYSVVKTNLYTVAPNITGAVVLVILGFSSDLTRMRFPFVAIGFVFMTIGFIVFAAVDIKTELHVAYFSTYLMTWGLSTSVILDSWYNNCIAKEGQRIVLTSIAVPVANLMGIVSSNIFRAKDAPKYVPALATTAAFSAAGFLLTIGLGFWMMIDNKRRNVRQGKNVKAKDIPSELLANGPASDDYRWFL